VTRIDEQVVTGTTPRRTSPLIVLVHTVTFRQARNLVPAVLGLGAAFGVNGGTPVVVGLAVGITLLSLVSAGVSWWRFGYVDGPTAVVVTSGLLARKVRTVPNDRIRGVEVEAPALHRVFGLVRVRVDAAAGAAGKDEELVVDGVTFADELPRDLLPRLEGPDLSDLRVVVAVLAVAVLLLVVGSVVGAAVVNWRFRLVRRGGSLVATRGLITRRHTELEIDRIRGCTVSEGLGMRVVRAARVSALVTGLGDAARRGQLLPLAPRREVWPLAHRLVDDPGPLTRHPLAARRRRIVRAIAGGLVVSAAGVVATAVAGWWWLLVMGVVLVVLGVPLGVARYRALGHRAGPRSLAVRSGWLVREHAVLQRRAVVGWQVRQSLFQRRARLATVVACVGAGSGGYGALDMAADEVADFTAAASSGTWSGVLRP
jgi:putative membrane protein